MSTRPSRSNFLLLFAGAFLLVAASKGPTIETSFHGHADYERYRTYAWVEGIPSTDPAMQRHLVAAIDRELGRKGWQLMNAEADLTLKVDVMRLQIASIGALRIDLIDTRSRNLAWQALVTNATATERAKLPKLIDKTIKQAFKKFPKAGK